MKCIISPHDISLLYLLPPLTHNPPWCRTTVRPCEIVLPRTAEYFIFSSSCFYFIFFSLVFSFILHSADLRLLLCVKLLCMFPTFTGFADAHPGTKVCFSAVQMLHVSYSLRFNGNFMAMKIRLWRQNEGVFPNQTLFLCWWVKCSLFFSPPGFQINLSGLPQSKPSLLNRVCPLCSRLGKPVLCPRH